MRDFATTLDTPELAQERCHVRRAARIQAELASEENPDRPHILVWMMMHPLHLKLPNSGAMGTTGAPRHVGIAAPTEQPHWIVADPVRQKSEARWRLSEESSHHLPYPQRRFRRLLL